MSNTTPFVKPWVQEIIDETFGPHLEIGMVTKHPDGRTVKIVDGQYMGTFGLSNFWDWQEVLPDGTLGKKECGYGWNPT